MALGMPSQFLTWQRYTAPDHYFQGTIPGSRVWLVWIGQLDTFSLSLSRLDPLRLPARDPQGTKWTLPMNLPVYHLLWSLLRNPKGRSALGGFPKS